MKTISNQEAISLLVELFDRNALTFRSIAVLKDVFDEAVEVCDNLREEAEVVSTYKHGAGYLPSKAVEEDARGILAGEVEQHLYKSGIGCNSKVKDVLIDLLIEKCEYSSEDFYLL